MDITKVNQAFEDLRHRFDGPENTQTLLDRVGELISLEPENFKILHVQGTVGRFTSTVDINIDCVKTLVDGYTSRTSETLRALSQQPTG